MLNVPTMLGSSIVVWKETCNESLMKGVSMLTYFEPAGNCGARLTEDSWMARSGLEPK